jgi:uncharacterized protein
MQSERESFANPADISAVLDMQRIAVVGLSSDPRRESYSVSQYMQSNGYEITPINPNEAEVLGEQAYPRLTDLPEPPEVVNVFRRPEFLDEVVDDAISAGAKAIWIQLGIVNEGAARRARDAGLITVMDRCIRTEHMRRQFGRPRELY